MSNEPAAEDQSHKIHHALEEQVPAHEISHAVVIIPFGNEESVIALFELLAFNVLVGKRLHHTDACQCILQARVYISDFSPVFHKGFLHTLVLSKRKNEHAQNENYKRKSQPPVDKEEEDKGADDLHQRDEEVFRSMMRKFRDVEQVRYKLAHHLPRVILTVIGKRKFFIMIEELLAHIPLHIGSHHVALITHVIFAQTLENIHDQQSGGDPWQSMQDCAAVACEQCVCHGAQDLRVRKIHDTDKSRTYEVNKKDRLVRRVIIYEFSDRVHDVTPFYLNY